MKLGFKANFLSFVFSIAGLPVAAWAIRDLWRWFVVPLGVSPIGLIAAAGLAVLIRYLATQPPSAMVLLHLGVDEDRVANDSQRRFYVVYSFMTSFIWPLGTWVVGYVIHAFGPG